MDHYLDIRILPDPDFVEGTLMGVLYSKLHRALFDLDADDIGISLPDHRTGIKARTPGNRLRVHGRRERLEELMNMPWYFGMRDHIHVGELNLVPSSVSYRTVSRRQFNTGSPSRVRRLAKRHNLDIDEARKLLETPASRKIPLPFLQVPSRSTRQRFALFIEHGEVLENPLHGKFNHYGLSREATIPWF
ncbi:type I-F CRISPR-associated endoribonuclease Cas6/Csy4 [Cernens ardua]|uniref:type I-F CRISPR-associated endoribonuclease Cas6/Csy4 n=1 Tax=Cernens ardua TaxID=3402176 RepID=UPI003F9D13B1